MGQKFFVDFLFNLFFMTLNPVPPIATNAMSNTMPMKPTDHKDRIYLFDTTLRDGAQTQGVNFSLHDKIAIAKNLDQLGLDYIEGGFPGANPLDDEFFQQSKHSFTNATLTAFGMTRRAGRSADNDTGLRASLNSGAKAVCLVAKFWDKQVTEILDIELEENARMIKDSLELIVANGMEAMLDAEHFFDGFLSNPKYVQQLMELALNAGARWLVFCDTRGGMIPDKISEILNQVKPNMDFNRAGIHAHNDTDCAVANSLAAVAMGVRQVQGTLNGLGERSGNANILSLMADLHFKLGLDIGAAKNSLHLLTTISHQLDERLAKAPNPHLPYVGANAFAHKGGLHGSAVAKNPESYEHIEPHWVGNSRVVVMSDQSGRANLRWHLNNLNITLQAHEEKTILESLKQAEYQGYSFDGANASFELFLCRQLPNRHQKFHEFFTIEKFQVIDESIHINQRNRPDFENQSTAEVTVSVNGHSIKKTAHGNGPVNALDSALRLALLAHFPELKNVSLIDYKVRIIPPSEQYQSTGAMTRVMIESAADAGANIKTLSTSNSTSDLSNNLHNNTDAKKTCLTKKNSWQTGWTTVGLSSNVIAASAMALGDAYRFYLWKNLSQ